MLLSAARHLRIPHSRCSVPSFHPRTTPAGRGRGRRHGGAGEAQAAAGVPPRPLQGGRRRPQEEGGVSAGAGRVTAGPRVTFELPSRCTGTGRPGDPFGPNPNAWRCENSARLAEVDVAAGDRLPQLRRHILPNRSRESIDLVGHGASRRWRRRLVSALDRAVGLVMAATSLLYVSKVIVWYRSRWVCERLPMRSASIDTNGLRSNSIRSTRRAKSQRHTTSDSSRTSL